MAGTKKLKPYVTRREMQAALMVVAKAADASIEQLRAEFEARIAALEAKQQPPLHEVEPSLVCRSEECNP